MCYAALNKQHRGNDYYKTVMKERARLLSPRMLKKMSKLKGEVRMVRLVEK